MDKPIRYGWETIRFHNDSYLIEHEIIAIEFPLTIMLNGEEFATMVCTPNHLKKLVTGFLASEGIIRRYSEIQSLSIDHDSGFAHVELSGSIQSIPTDHSKRVIGSCCGKSRQFYFKSDLRTAKTVTSHFIITPKQCYRLMKKLQDASTYFHKTGNIHNAALCTIDEILFIREDIGRHNALDKIYGDILIKQIPLHGKLIVFSGRVSSEVLLKIAKMGVGILVSKSAPTDLALELANDLGITVVGFVRGQKMNVYTHPKRIKTTTSHKKVP